MANKKVKNKKTKPKTTRAVQKKQVPVKKPVRVQKTVFRKKSGKKTVISLDAPAFTQAPVAITPVIQQNNVSPITAKQSPFVAPKSAHVLNLKQIAFDQHLEQTQHQQKAKNIQRIIQGELSNATKHIPEAKSKFNDLFKAKRAQHQPIKEDPHYIMPKETIVSTIVMEQAVPVAPKAPRKPLFTTPKISLVRMPKMSIRMPRFESPLFSSTYTRKAVTSFVIASLLLVSPLWAYDSYQKVNQTKGKIFGIATSAFEHLKNSEKEGVNQATELDLAAEKLQLAQNELSNVPDLINAILAVAPNGSKLETGKKLLHIAQTSSNLAHAFVALLASDTDSKSLYDRLGVLLPELTEQKSSINSIQEDITSINPDDIPEQYREQFNGVAEIINNIAPHIDALLEQANLLYAMMGSQSEQRYLIIFQNTDELRAAGGFMGSYATAKFDQGKLLEFNIPPGGTYDLQAGLRANIEPPQPITAVSPRWEFQDTNWFADFPTSAKKIMSIYEKSGGTTVNGVIAINSTILPELLKLTGPIHLPTSGLEVNDQNVVTTLETVIDTNKEVNKPKKVLGELSDALLKSLSDQPSSTLPKLSKILLNSLTGREIQVYLKNPELQNIISAHSWDGKLIKTDGDYLNIVSTNIAGGKTNGVINDVVSLKSVINEDGGVTNILQITRTHRGNSDQPLTNEKNNDYLRVYVPLNATLISAFGFEPLDSEAFRSAEFTVEKDPELSIIKSTTTLDLASKTEIFSENGKTVFANWVQVNPGETRTVTITYRLPFNLSLATSQKLPDWMSLLAGNVNKNESHLPYSLIIQKQSGKINQTYQVEIETPKSLSYRWLYPSALNAQDNVYTYDNLNLERDAIIGIIFNK